MEKLLEIDGKQINFKTTAATALHYKAQFHRDYLVDVLKLVKLKKLQNLDVNNLDFDELSQVDFNGMYNLVWALAKTADRTIPDPISWFDQFQEFPIMEIFYDLIELVGRSLNPSKKK